MTDAERTVRGLLADLHATGEHERLEAKRANEIGKSVLETVCAFANTPDMGGGDLLLGVDRGEDEEGGPVYTVTGVRDPERLGDELATRCREQFNKPIRPRVRPAVIDGRTVVHAFVPESRPGDKPVYIKKLSQPKGVFLRGSATDQVATDDEIADLYRRRDRAPFDATAAREATPDDFDPDAVRVYRGMVERVNPSAAVLKLDGLPFFEALDAVRDDGGTVRPTVAGLLLFGTRAALRREFPMVRVDYIRVPGTEWVSDPDNRYEALMEAQTAIPLAVLRAEAAVFGDLPRKFHLPEGSLQRRDIPALPPKVVREAIVNAVMHRDDEVAGTTQIIRYADRIEVHNPGYSLKPPDQLGRPGTRPRNRLIAAALHDTDLAETQGTGIRTIRRLMEEAEKKPPEFVSRRADNQFTAVIPLADVLTPADRAWLTNLAAGAGQELTREDRLTLIHARDRGSVDNAAVRGMTNLDRNDVSVLFRKLRGLGLLEKEGAGPATYYVPSAALRRSLPDGVAAPEPFGPAAPAAGPAARASQSPAQPDKSAAQPAEPPPQPDMSTCQVDMLPEELRRRVGALGGRPAEDRMRATLRALCAWRALTANQLADLLGRNPAYLKARYLTPMADDPADPLARTLPHAPRSPRQAYRTRPQADPIVDPAEPLA